jgi:hypothetical protein
MRSKAYVPAGGIAVKNKSRIPTIALVLAALTALAAALLAVLLIGDAISLDGPATREGSTRLSLVILIFGEAVMVTLFGAFLFIGIEDWRRGIPLSALYPPQMAVMGTMAAYMTVTGLSVLDLLTHHLRPTWGILYTPVARIFQSVLLLTVFASFAWVLATVIRGRSDDRRRGGQTIAMRAALRRIARRLKRVERDTHIAKEHVNDLGARPPRDDRGGRE